MEANDRRRYQVIGKTLFLILLLNWAVALLKIAYGMASRCVSIAADGFHSLSDGASNIIGLVGITLASQPKDRDHPYGHKKYETLFSLGIAALLFVISFGLLNKGITRLYSPVMPAIDQRGFVIMAATLLINIAVMKYERGKGLRLQSDILISDSMHTRADILVSVSVIIALAAIKLGYPVIDPLATIIIGLFIARTAIGIIRQCSTVLCDSAAILEVKKISDIVLGIKGVMTCHKIRTRGRPDDIHVDLHIQINPDMHIDQAHKISYRVEDEIRRAIPQVTDVVVHLEPKE